MRRLALLSAAAVLGACQPQAANDTTAPNQEVLVPAPAPEPGPVNGIPDQSPPAVPPPANSPPASPATPPKAAADYRSNLRLVGTEPFWGVQITASQIKLQRPDHADIAVANTGPEINGEVASWNTRELKITLKPASCSDGMSDNVYPYEATVRVGSEVLKGCAMRADGLPLRPH